MELAPLTGLVDGIVDLTASGTTLAENDLQVVERDRHLHRPPDREPGGAQAEGRADRLDRGAGAGHEDQRATRWAAARVSSGVEPVAEIIERGASSRRRCRRARAAPSGSTTRELGPDQLRVDPNELEASIGVLEPDVLGGLRTAIANVKAVAKAQVRDEPVTVSSSPEGHTVEVVEQPVRRAGVYVPGGRAPYPSTVVMGAVTARAAGVREIAVCAPPGPGRPGTPGDPRRVRALRGDRGLPDGRCAGDRRARIRHRVGDGRRRDRRSRAIRTCRRRSARWSARSASTGIAGPSELVVIAAGAGADPELHRARPAGSGRARRGQPCLVSLAGRRAARCRRGDRRAAPPDRSSVADAELQADRRGRRGRSAQPGGADRARAPRARGRGGRGARRPRSERRLPVRGRAARPRPSATTSPARTTCCPPAAPRASSRRSRRPRSGAAWLAYPCPARRAARLAPAGAALARAEGFPVHAESMERRA